MAMLERIGALAGVRYVDPDQAARNVAGAIAVNAAARSLSDQQDPTGSNHQKHGQEEQGHEESEPVEFGLGKIIAADEDHILATTLRGDDRTITAREQQSESHQRRRHTPADADLEKNPQ